MPVGLPVLETMICRACRHLWNAFFPRGRENDNDIECPLCGQFTGKAQDSLAP
jgi:hypothetical protein